MRGFLRPALRYVAGDAQKAFRTFSRSRQSKLAKAAKTNLVKAHQWATRGNVPSVLGKALEQAVAGHLSKRK